jgi:hypothetical protein
MRQLFQVAFLDEELLATIVGAVNARAHSILLHQALCKNGSSRPFKNLPQQEGSRQREAFRPSASIEVADRAAACFVGGEVPTTG